jgi:hypothetical protein
LLPYTALHNFLRIVPFRQIGFVPSEFEVSTLKTPTKTTMQRAIDNSRCHLNALMTLYAIELLFVAGTTVDKRFVEPSAPFDG